MDDLLQVVLQLEIVLGSAELEVLAELLDVIVEPESPSFEYRIIAIRRLR